MKNADKPAFPYTDGVNFAWDGMSKREYFAAMAMQGMISNPSLNYGLDFEMINQKAVACADQLLKQLES